MTAPSTSTSAKSASGDRPAETSSGERPAETSVATMVNTALVTPHGKTSIADVVVEKIAGMAAREISGVHKLGGASARAFGAIRELVPGQRPSMSQGVTVEVGERQAAVDLDMTVEYGVEIGELTKAVRRNVINAIERMTTLEVTEVNIMVHDVHLPDDEDDDHGAAAEPRVE